ncbi:MAG: hypothetical protein AB1791_10460 [Chloroflexota bacterium]
MWSRRPESETAATPGQLADQGNPLCIIVRPRFDEWDYGLEL